MSKQVALERELAQLTQINSVVGKLVSTIQTANSDIHKVHGSINNTNELLFKWVQILSQTTYTKDIISNSNWNGEDIDLDKKLTEEAELKRQLNELERENEQLADRLEQDDTKRRRI
ncbi:hypothetical protein PSN45_000148 [Yamadazyma tenuis]|uniref:DASH complex subunit DUO1 n=1 Tax=Candida tenuis (strain ATCC 10573 / BCRC 21748 / CBS 615 / JCM 9827 / NBRC 10315 / NRRL Y-1498 / VKM Y-70) TaxID=590646 RepID=G3BAY1_CANTC|nr:uncharacterized protein CANTEDRAFT_135429 [Yamadazyma tenuis ATCC 10573]EGV61480.1 hypothetical protein CANTEDRAFT_135429 [Yamadazyma tenuis ATCC 10573]WEJ92693.1 hypothetical protein PSN45_000148 [Yamadazyma tenuis]